MDDRSNRLELGRAYVWNLSLLQRFRPGNELHRRIDRKQRNHDKQRDLSDERRAVKVVRGSLFEVEHPEKTYHQYYRSRNADRRVGELEAARAPAGQVVPEHHKAQPATAWSWSLRARPRVSSSRIRTTSTARAATRVNAATWWRKPKKAFT